MATRDIIKIDEEKCNGCGLCVNGCAEGALAIVDGKAKLVSDIYCDGLGACLKECPQAALTVIKRDAPDFDEKAVERHLARQKKNEPRPIPETLACGCPSTQVRTLPILGSPQAGPSQTSALRNWPVQLHLVPVKAPFFNEAALLIAADCTGFSATNLHRDLLPGKTLLVACPKLDDTRIYLNKLEEIFRENAIKDITVLYMTVPCCAGLVYLVREALAHSGKSIPLRIVRIDPTGEVVEESQAAAA